MVFGRSHLEGYKSRASQKDACGHYPGTEILTALDICHAEAEPCLDLSGSRRHRLDNYAADLLVERGDAVENKLAVEMSLVGPGT